jgi:hypothetical protein
MQAWTSKKAREVVSLGRELLGGNGILVDFLVAKVRGVQQLLCSYMTRKKEKGERNQTKFCTCCLIYDHGTL